MSTFNLTFGIISTPILPPQLHISPPPLSPHFSDDNVDETAFLEDTPLTDGPNLSFLTPLRRSVFALQKTRNLPQPSPLAIQKFLDEVYASALTDYGVDAAVSWGGDFEFPRDIWERDESRLLSHGNDLCATIRSIHAESRQFRLSLDRISLSTSDIPDIDPLDILRLQNFAEGVRIFVTEDFTPNCIRPPLRPMYRRVHSALNKMMLDLYESGNILIMRTSTLETLPNIHWSPKSWAPKKGKPKGRPIGDVANGSGSHPPLNHPSLRDTCKSNWGPIEHPTLSDIVNMILEFQTLHPNDIAVLWKMDLKGAFHLLSIHPEDVHLLAFELTQGLSMLYHTGMFGWTGFPYAFQVVTRVLRQIVNFRIREFGAALMYVDDIIGICSSSHLSECLRLAQSSCETLLGPGSVEPSKTIHGRRIDAIGWCLDLDTSSVGIAKHNLFKTVQGFFHTDTSKPVSLQVLQRLASWASRYSQICRALRPFSGDLYKETCGLSNPHFEKLLEQRTITTIKLWRTFLCLTEIGAPSSYRRPFSSFRDLGLPNLILEYDASLKGIGVAVYSLSREGSETLMWVFQTEFPFSFENVLHQAKFQNTCEFIAVTVGICVLRTLGLHNAPIILRGDSKSSLRWADTETFKGNFSRRAALLFLMVSERFGTTITRSIHIPGVTNTLCDGLSRGMKPVAFNLDPSLVVQENSWTGRLVALCNPLKEAITEEDIFGILGEIHELLSVYPANLN